MDHRRHHSGGRWRGGKLSERSTPWRTNREEPRHPKPSRRPGFENVSFRSSRWLVDAYPDQVFRGEVIRLGHSATSEFALLPNPNPSGNFTKVTQRLPVRVSIEQNGLLLRPGMMVEVEIDAVD